MYIGVAIYLVSCYTQVYYVKLLATLFILCMSETKVTFLTFYYRYPIIDAFQMGHATRTEQAASSKEVGLPSQCHLPIKLPRFVIQF